MLRINFSKRLNIPTITTATETTPSGLLYEAHCQTNGTTFNVTSFRAVEWSVDDVIETVKKHPTIKACTGYRSGGKFFLFIVNVLDDIDNDLVPNIENYLRSTVHDYMIPTDFIVVRENALKEFESVDGTSLSNLLKRNQQNETHDDDVTLALCDIFGLAIGITENENFTPFPANGNFFHYGGNSLKTGFLVSAIRTKLGVSLPVTTLYDESCQTPVGLAEKCRESIAKDHILLTHGYEAFRMTEGDALYNKTFQNSNYKKRMKSRPLSGAKNPFNPLIMLFQASPLFLIQPLAHIFRWTVFVHILLLLSSVHRTVSFIAFPNLLWLLATLLITGIILSIAFPVIGIVMKWLVIGRYRSGTYPLWGVYYLRWWFINKLLLITGAGIFKSHDRLFVLYLRLMGTTVGSNSCVSCDAQIKEFDLIKIGSNCYVDDCTIRPFRLITGHMNLSNIVIGDGCVIGFRTNVVAGTTIANDTAVGPQTTTYARDMQCIGSSAPLHTEKGETLRNLCKETFPLPHFLLQLLVGWPIVIVTQILSHIPWFYCLHLLTNSNTFSSKLTVAELIVYMTHPHRLGYYLLATIVRNYIVHLLYVILVIVIKRIVIGKFKAGPRDLGQLALMKHWLMETLLSKQEWQTMSKIVGSHYEGVSMIYRLLGAKIGKRVYWPGSTIRLIEFDLLTVGNDVIFGSRSRILCSDAREYAPVTIDDGAMCGDNCVILPGAHIGRNAILGTGGLLAKHFNLAHGSIWYGSYNGNAIKLRDGTVQSTNWPTIEVEKKSEWIGASTSTIITMGSSDYGEETIRPFGRAFYKRKANYFVFPLAFIIICNFLFLSIGTILSSTPILGALQLTALIIQRVTQNRSVAHSILLLFGFFSMLYALMATLILCLEIAVKWALIGRRKPGTYNWDTSSYCQRWQILIGIQNMGRNSVLDLIGGSSWIVLFFRAMGCTIGQRVCLYPNGGDPVLTEPDLVVLEDDVAVDKASLVCHLNTLGEFTLNPLWIGAGSILQNDSRLAPGATMLENCTLLDRSYIIQGEITEAGSVWQGYPAISTSFDEQYAMFETKSASKL